MPKYITAVQETEDSILRPVVFEVARKVMEMTRISDKTQLFFPSNIQRIAQTGTTLTPADPKNPTNYSDSDQRIVIEVEENYRDEVLGTVAVNYPENRFFFADDVLGMYMKPIFVPTEITLNFKFRAIDPTAALRWRDGIRTQMELMLNQHNHQATFNYLVPMELIAIAKEVHRLRENVEGYGDTFERYLRDRLTVRASIVTTLIGTEPRWTVAEKARRITGWFDFEGQPEKGSFEDGTTGWTISFAYKFEFDKPVFCHVDYPLVVHQQVVKYVPKPPDTDDRHLFGGTNSALLMNWFESQNITDRQQPWPGYSIPSYDEFIPNTTVYPTRRIVTVLTATDPADPLSLFNLGQLPNLTWSSDVLDFLKAEATYVTKPYASLIDLSLYRNADLMEVGSFIMDAQLNIKFTNAQSRRDNYRVRCAIHENWRLVDPAALDRARDYGRALIELINLAFPWADQIGLLPELLGDNYVPKQSLDDLIDYANRYVMGNNPNFRVGMITVGTTSILSKREHA